MNKTTLESLEEALERLEQIDGMYSWAHLLYEVREAMAEQEKQEPVNQKAVGCYYGAADHIGHVVRIDVEIPIGTLLYAAPVSAKPCKECGAKQAQIDRLMLEYCPDEMTHEQMQEWERNIKPFVEPVNQEPVAVVDEIGKRLDGTYIFNAVGKVDVGQPLYAAPVSANREWVDLEPWQLCEIEERIGLPIDSHDFETIGNAYIAAFKERNN